jgi:hypothetical protein
MTVFCDVTPRSLVEICQRLKKPTYAKFTVLPLRQEAGGYFSMLKKPSIRVDGATLQQKKKSSYLISIKFK